MTGLRRDQASETIRAILRAQSTANAEDDLHAHLQAVDLGPESRPTIREALFGNDWRRIARGKLAVLTALALIAHDIDEDAGRAMTNDLLRHRKIHPVFRGRLRSIGRFTLQDYDAFEVAGTKVYVEKAVGRLDRRKALLRRWLSVPPAHDLRGIRRIFVVREDALEQWGVYRHVLSCIGLVWRGLPRPSWLSRLRTEYTVYHEIGHHVHRRADRGDRIRGEARADAYAMEQLRASHPLLFRGLHAPGVATLVMGKARFLAAERISQCASWPFRNAGRPREGAQIRSR